MVTNKNLIIDLEQRMLSVWNKMEAAYQCGDNNSVVALSVEHTSLQNELAYLKGSA